MYLGLLLSLILISSVFTSPESDLKTAMTSLQSQRSLKGLQLQVTDSQEVVFNLNLGQKNNANEPVDSNTMFRIASVSKSFSSVALMQLVQKGKLNLKHSLSSIFGYTIQNPNFPGVDITVQMILSHQSSLVECEPYYTNFLTSTYTAATGSEVPKIKQILVKGGKYYNDCLFSNKHKPGTNFHYVNLNFGIAGTIVEIISQVRFDIYQRDNILIPLSEGLAQVATFNPATITNPKNLGVCYNGDAGKWVPSVDNYPSGTIPQRNLTGYKIGDNGVIYGPQGALRASVSHLTNYAIMLKNKGTTSKGKVILSPASVEMILRPHYQFSGLTSGSANDFHLYGFGIFTTTYRRNDVIINHQVVRGHTGAAYNLISAQHFWQNFTLTYIINGALYGYKYGTGTIYEYQRLAIYQAVEKFVNTFGKKQENGQTLEIQ